MKIETGIFIFLFWFFLLGIEAQALEFLPLSVPELIGTSSEIVHASCISAEGIQTGGGYISTRYTFLPYAFAKGSLPNPFSFDLSGGSIGEETMCIPDMPIFIPGNDYVLFLENGFFILSGEFRVRSGDERPEERILQDVPFEFPLYSAVSKKILPYGSEVKVKDFFFSMEKFMSGLVND